MPARAPLSDSEIDAGLPEGWTRVSAESGNRIQADFRFDDFRAAIAFIVRLAFEAEQMDHHPDLSNVYDRVSVALSTHDADNRVTETDLVLARRVSALVAA